MEGFRKYKAEHRGAAKPVVGTTKKPTLVRKVGVKWMRTRRENAP
jgi:hypothetical protein